MKTDRPRPSQLRIPPWVPEPIAVLARNLSRAGMAPYEHPLLVASEADFQRLLRALTTHPRMKWVWRELGKRHRDGYLHPPRQPEDPQGLAMTMLFFHALKIVRDVSPDQVASVSRKDLTTAREQFATTALILRTLAVLYLEPRRVSGRVNQLEREDARKLDAAADVVDQLAQTRVKRVHERNVLIRHITGELVKACRIIFRKSMYGIVANIASVLLGTDIPESTIRNWHPDPRK